MKSFCLAVLLAGFPAATFSQDALLQPLLSREILAPKQEMIEVQVYTQARVPAIPPIASAAEWEKYSANLRARILNEVVLRGKARAWNEMPAKVEWLDTIAGDGYKVKKLRFEAVPGLWVPALLYEPEKLHGKVAAVLNVNGHEGQGKAIPYIQARCINLAKRGVLALNPEWIGKGELDAPGYAHTRMQQLDLCGTSGVSVFYLSLKRSLDILLAHPNADPERLAVTGLSGGGWQTIFLSALDPRVRLANPVAGYSSFATRSLFPETDLGDSEQTPTDLAAVADYTHLTAMLAPRPALLTYNALDTCCFQAEHALGSLMREVTPIYRLFGAEDRLRSHVNFDPGHNYGQDNREAFHTMLRDFFAKDGSFPIPEIPVDSEIRTAGQLRVELPAGNEDLHTLALQLSRGLPHPGGTRAQLETIVRARRYPVKAVRTSSTLSNGVTAVYWRLSVGDEFFTVPAVELSKGEPQSTAILMADGGRVSASEEAARLLDEGKRVLAIDPLYFGEARIEKRDWLFAILIASLGDRLLGIQASQVAAVARWIRQERHDDAVQVVAIGPRTGLSSLIATALEPAIARVIVHKPMRSLKEILDKDLTADKNPELFCFGLLEWFDVDQLVALVAPRRVQFLPAQ